MTIVDVGLLGPLRLEFGAGQANLGGGKLRTIVALLALRADAELRRDELIEELDLMRTTGDTVNALHAHMARLRRWLHQNGGRPTMLQTVHSGYRLDIDPTVVDAHRFVALVERGLGLAPSAPSVLATILEEALALWRGDALLDVGEGPMAASAADELHRWRAAAREALVDAWMVLGRNQQVVLCAPRYIQDDPWNESLRARHILALKRMHRYAEAEAAYRTSTRILSEELGIAPGPELRAAKFAPPSDTFEPAYERHQPSRMIRDQRSSGRY